MPTAATVVSMMMPITVATPRRQAHAHGDCGVNGVKVRALVNHHRRVHHHGRGWVYQRPYFDPIYPAVSVGVGLAAWGGYRYGHHHHGYHGGRRWH